jgi:uncharacterized protein
VIFVDTSAFFALLDADDMAHERARNAFEMLVRSLESLATTNYVIAETLSLVQRRLGMLAAKTLIRDIFPIVSCTYVDAALHESAIDLFVNENRRKLSFVDCASITYMRRQQIAQALAFDDDFERFGIETIG